MTDDELLKAERAYIAYTGKTPSMAWYAERGDKNAQLYCNFFGFLALAVIISAPILGTIATIRILSGG